MSDTRKPRHIRDIAHLYISRPHYRPQQSQVALWIAGEKRSCFPGLHVANLAAAFSARDWRVEIFDRSGLLPNAGYYLALSPRQYLGWEDGGGHPTSGLGRVTFSSGLRDGGGIRGPNEQAAPAGSRLEIVHLPLLDAGSALRDCLQEVGGSSTTITVFLVLVANESFEIAPAVALAEGAGAAMTCVLHVGESSRLLGTDEPSLFDLGHVSAWTGTVADRVAAVVRAPDCSLSRSYGEVSDNLLAGIRQWRRAADADREADVSGGNRSGERHSGSEDPGTVLQIPRRHLRFSR